MLKEIKRKVLSYCEIPEKIRNNHWINEFQNGCLVSYTVTSLKEQDKFDDDFSIDNWIIKNYPEIKDNEEILIDIDY